jgi:AraC-like DNA-binding protein
MARRRREQLAERARQPVERLAELGADGVELAYPARPRRDIMARVRQGALIGRNLMPLVASARRRGIGDDRLRLVGIEPERLAALDYMVPARCIYRLVEELAPLVDLEPFAIEVATGTTASDSGIVGLAMRAAPTARQALALFIRYQRLVNTVAGFHVLADGDALTLAEERCGPDGSGRLIAAEISAMTIVYWARLLLGASAAPVRVAVPRRGRFERYAAWAGCPVVGGAGRAGVTFDAATLDAVVLTTDEELWRYFGDVLASHDAGAAAPTAQHQLVQQLRQELAKVLCDGAPSIRQMAQRLGQTSRTLQRRLAEEGLRFSGVLDDLRHELAIAHLGRGELAIAEIAFTLGFDEVASFHRAFRRWQGTTPAAFRAALVRGAASSSVTG